MLAKCKTKFDCLVKDTFIRKLVPDLKVRTDSIRLFVDCGKRIKCVFLANMASSHLCSFSSSYCAETWCQKCDTWKNSPVELSLKLREKQAEIYRPNYNPADSNRLPDLLDRSITWPKASLQN